MPYSSPKPSSVQWQAQTRIRSAPHSPTLRPRTTPPESVEDFSFPETDLVEQLSALASGPALFQAPNSLPKSATPLPPIKPLPQPTPQRPQSPTSPKLPVSNASATKTRTVKDRPPTSSPEASAEANAPEPQKPQVFVAPEKSGRKHMPKDPSRLTNGVSKPITNGIAKPVNDNVGTLAVNGVEIPVVNGLQTERAASSAPQSWPPSGVEVPVLPPQEPTQQPSTPQAPQASPDSDDEGAQGRSTPDDLKSAVIVSADTTGSSQTPMEGRRKESLIKRFLLRFFSCFGGNRRRNRQ